MVMSIIERRACSGSSPDLRGARILLTGLELGHGVDVARALGDAGCRLMTQCPALTSEIDVLLEELARSAQEVRFSATQLNDDESALRFAQSAVTAYGGLDAVINLARLQDSGLRSDASLAEIEDRVARTLGPAFRITDVVANRMQLTWTEGLILNIVTQGRVDTPAAAAIGQLARAALAGLTRTEAAKRIGQGVRINAIVPADNSHAMSGNATTGMASEPEIAALAVHLAANPDHALSGLVFDAAGVGCMGA